MPNLRGSLKIILNSGNLEKKSKIRSLFEKSKTLVTVPFYEDTHSILSSIAQKFFRIVRNEFPPKNGHQVRSVAQMGTGSPQVIIKPIPERLADIRRNRVAIMNDHNLKEYTNLDSIKKEVNVSKNIFKRNNWPIIDVTRRSVEETAASILKIIEIKKHK